MFSGWTSEVTPEEWDRFIEANWGTPFQSWAWRSLMADSGANPEYLVYRSHSGDILAACPEFRVRRGRYNQRLMGAPISGRFAGIEEEPEILSTVLPIPSLFAEGVDLTQAARALQEYLGRFRLPPMSSMELMTSQRRVLESFGGLGFKHWMAYSYYVTDLAKTPTKKIWEESFHKHDRQAVKYYDRLETSFRLSSADSDFSEFLRLHEQSTFRKGYRPIRESFLSLMRKHMGKSLLVALTAQAGQLIVGQLAILDKAHQTLHMRETGYLRQKNIHSPVVHSWFNVCEWAEKNGFRYVNFGGARSDEAHRLKRKFDGEITDNHVIVVPNTSKVYSYARAMRGLLTR